MELKKMKIQKTPRKEFALLQAVAFLFLRPQISFIKTKMNKR